MSTRIAPWGGPRTDLGDIGPKTALGLPPVGTAIDDFDTWRPGYGRHSVLVIRANTTEHAPLFKDPLLTEPAPNPITLLTWHDENGTSYGRWPHAVYTYVPYRMVINETDVTSVQRPPLVDLVGQDVSQSIAATSRGRYPRTLQLALDREIYAQDFGSLAIADGSAAVSAVITRAIAAAAAQGGGTVFLPAGDIAFVSATLPENVVLEGAGVGVTTLISQSAQAVITLAGDRAGLRNLTLDGVNVNTGSIGVYGVGLVGVVFESVEIKRFSDGLLLRGARYCNWFDLSITNCVNAGQLRGDTDPSGAGAGGEVRGVNWKGGAVTLNTTSGIQLWFFDDLVDGVTLDGILIGGNLGPGLLLNGARNIRVLDPQWEAAAGVPLLQVQDDSNLARAADNTIDHVSFEGGVIRGGKLTFNGSCANVAFIRGDLRGAALAMSVPKEPIILQDCIEDADVAISGDKTKLMRVTTADEASVAGFTTDATPITGWSEVVEPGGIAFYEASVVAQRQDGAQYGIFMVAAGVARPGSTMTFDTQTANFTEGLTVTGATSGATGRIIAVTQASGSGTLTLGDVDGVFVIGEQITDTDGGDAMVSGALTPQNAALDGVGNVNIRAAALSASTTYLAEFDVSGATVRLRLTGMNTHLVQWTARVRRLRT